jgi:hypothetical protein
MDNYKHETDGAMVTTEPLFASVWLALYYSLRQNYDQRRSVKSVNCELSTPQKEK